MRLAFVLSVLVAGCTGKEPTTPAVAPITVPSASAAAGGVPAPTSSAPVAECVTDADCGGATCCHPSACVPVAQRPSCAGMMCTMDCRGGTLDCGGGSCLCQSGKCAIVLRDRRRPDAGP